MISLKMPIENSSGSTAIEYCLIASGIAMAIVLAVTALGDVVGDIFDSFASFF